MDLHDLPLSFLPTFEAAGRLGSFKAAALALHVTPSAVSQQIKALEEALGVALFERRGRTVALTDVGREYLEDVRRALGDLTVAATRLRERRARSVLRLTTVPLVAHEFLLPRRAAFQALFPDLELQVEATMAVVDLQTSELDAALRVGGGPWPGLVTRPIGQALAAPVCSAERAARVRTLADLQREPLLEVRGQEHRTFEPLLRSQGLSAHDAPRLRFETCLETLHAAQHGLGVALGIFPFASQWVESGRVAVPLAERIALPGQVSLVHRHADDARFPFAALARWLTEQFASLSLLPPGRRVPGELQRRAVTPLSSRRAARS